MKTPEEIKKGLYHCGADDVGCTGCSYNKKNVRCEGNMEIDALTYIVTLENLLAQVERERDAAIHDMVQIVHEVDDNACVWCKNAYFDELKCKECRFNNEGFEWQGVQPTNTKEE